MNGATMTSWQYLVNGPIAGWMIVGTGDFNGDGKTDILWENPNAGVTVWFYEWSHHDQLAISHQWPDWGLDAALLEVGFAYGGGRADESRSRRATFI